MKKKIVQKRITPKLAKIMWDIIKLKKQRKFVVNGGIMSQTDFDEAQIYI